MKIIRDYQFVKSSDKGASVAVGNFDGVHLGSSACYRHSEVMG
jgi:riboflavin kinase/FMN adenylyltransferase